MVGISAAAVARRAGAAPAFVFLTGVISSCGPCVAPRFVAISACASEASRPRAAVLAFVTGLVCAYASFGFAASLFAGLHSLSSLVYGAVALALAAGGLVTITHATHGGERETTKRRPQTLGGLFLLGGSFAFVVSPCCTPLLATILAYTSLVGDRTYGATMLAAFALGHSTPLIAYGVLGLKGGEALRRIALGQAVSTVNGALMLALAGYYALLV